ncbi:MAG: putative CXXCH cytochrome family protein [Sulfurimonas sp.]|jgi:predicted CXXCH cytochrome family protein
MKAIIQKVLLSLFIVGSFFALSANEMFIFQTAKVKIDDKNATLYIGTPIKVLKSIDDKNVLVEFTGIAFEDKLYTSKTKSLLMATKQEGNFGEKEQSIKVQAIIEKGYLSKMPSEIWEEHEEFFYEMCTQCHAAHQPKEHTMLEWDAILQTMSGFAQLYADESEYLARFLKANANDGFYPEKK